MVRYFVVSLILHIFVMFFITWRQSAIIDDPIVAVELESHLLSPGSNENQLKAAPRQALPKVVSAEPTIENQPSTSENNPSAGAPIESQLITLKPKVLHQEKIGYPLEAEKARVEGAVKLSVVIDPQGRVTEVKVLEGPGYGLNEAASAALMRFRFSPAEKEGEKVFVRITYIYRFRLDSR